MISAALLTDEIAIYQPKVNISGTSDYVERASCVPCRIEQMLQSSIQEGDFERVNDETIKIFLLPDIVIEQEDEVRFENRVFRVTRVSLKKSFCGPHHKMALAVAQDARQN